MNFELKLEKFSGPMEKLLELIEEKKLETREVSLAQVTDDFLEYLKSLSEKEVDIRLIADFIAVASRLILIKSKFLLPDLTLTSEEEEQIKDLEGRLRLYQEIKPTLKIIAQLWRGRSKAFGRAYFLDRGDVSGVFYPGEKLSLEPLIASLDKLFDGLHIFELETQTIREKIITIEEKIEEIVKRLEIELETRFADLSNAKARTEIIAIFLAVLHLARERLISLEQSGHFSDIIIRKHEARNT